jgi:parallel beta-helix repeat protein
MKDYLLMRKGLVVGIILLFIGTSIVSGNPQDDEKSFPASRGDWLYVGGSGPGNYTKIQDAIDNASDGDTVFVYHDSSPYNETIIINTTLTLLGENQTTTQISGGGSPIVKITAPHTVISVFTITQPNNTQKGDVDGVYGFNCNDITIENSMIYGFYQGIYLEKTPKAMVEGNTIFSCNYCINVQQSSRTILQKNTLNGVESIGIYFGYGNTIRNNSINGVGGITLFFSLSFDCSSNHFTHCRGAVDCETTPYGRIRYNTFQDCEYGIGLTATVGMWVVSNTFLNTTHEAELLNSFFCHWRHNYWNQPRLLPKIIPGEIFIPLGFYVAIKIPWVNIDWCPAKEPYGTPMIR